MKCDEDLEGFLDNVMNQKAQPKLFLEEEGNSSFIKNYSPENLSPIENYMEKFKMSQIKSWSKGKMLGAGISKKR